MASAHIEIPSTASRLSSEVRSFVDSLRRVVHQADDIKAIMDQVAMGGDWNALATKLGVTVEEAQAVYNLMGSVKGELEGTFITQLTARCG